MNKKRGFTLIELLAVIVILAVIALIATPLIMGTITKAKKNAMKDTAYGILKAGEQYAGEKLLTASNDYYGETISLPDDSKLQYKGGDQATGELRISSTGDIALAIHDNQFCALKTFNQSEIIVEDYDEDSCKIDTSTDESCFITQEAHDVTVSGINYDKVCEMTSNQICDHETIDYMIQSDVSKVVSGYEPVSTLEEMKNEGVIGGFTVDSEQAVAITGYRCGGNYLPDQSYTQGRDMNPVVPSEIDGKPVLMIDKQAFSTGYQGYADTLNQPAVINSISLPNTVKYIGEQAFGHNEIRTITIPSSVIYIGEKTFGYGEQTIYTNMETIINKTNRKFPWYILVTDRYMEQIEFFETGVVTLEDGTQVRITK